MSVPHLISESFAHAFLLPLQDPPPKPPPLPSWSRITTTRTIAERMNMR